MQRPLRVPPVADVTSAVELYYRTTQLKVGDLMTIFALKPSAARTLMASTRAAVQAQGIPLWYRGAVGTVAAYDVWQMDIKRMEAGVQKLRKLGLSDGKTSVD